MSIKRLKIEVEHRAGDFSLETAATFEADGCVAVFGPSGAGKSTLLRLIAGHARPQRGRIEYDGAVWVDTAKKIFTPPHLRSVGTVFQDGRLFPHLTVEQNLRYAVERAPLREDGAGVEETVAAFDLAPLLGRRPETLSGGERQRVALARTMLTRPQLLLLDEPLSALDRKRKEEILPYLDNLSESFGAPALYVSHNVDEVIRIADRTIILTDGRIEATGETAEIMNAYGLSAGAEIDSPGAILTATVTEHDTTYGLTRVSIGGSVISLPINEAKAVGANVGVRIDARNVAIALNRPEAISIRNILPATIASLEGRDGSAFVDVVMDVDGTRLRAQVTRAASDDLSLAPGVRVYALVKTAGFAI